MYKLLAITRYVSSSVLFIEKLVSWKFSLDGLTHIPIAICKPVMNLYFNVVNKSWSFLSWFFSMLCPFSLVPFYISLSINGIDVSSGKQSLKKFRRGKV